MGLSVNFLIIVGSLAAVLNAKDVGELCEDAFAAGNYAEAAITCDRAILQHPDDAFYKRLKVQVQNKLGVDVVESIKKNHVNTGVFQDPRDSHIYAWKQIGDHVWFTQNLAYLPQVQGVSEVSESSPRYYIYGFNGFEKSKAQNLLKPAGALYNWSAAVTACPNGWHLPSGQEWDELERELGSDSAGLELRASQGWRNSDPRAVDPWGFGALPGGYFSGSGYYYAGTHGFWWTSSEYGGAYADFRGLDTGSLGINANHSRKSNGYSVRCVQNQGPLFSNAVSEQEKAHPSAPIESAFLVPKTGLPRVEAQENMDQGEGRSKQDIMLVVRARTPGLKYIYMKYQKQGFVGGRIVIRFVIAPSGEVISATKSSSTTGNSAFDSEIIVKVSEWNFGPVPNSGNTTVTIPIAFSE